MLKLFATLFRGAAAVAEEQVADRHALLLLDQQIRDAASAVDRAKKALAIAIAQEAEEGRRLEQINGQILDLEERAGAALGAGRDDLASEGAEAIAGLEQERDAVAQARSSFTRETTNLRRAVRGATQRLAELERGRRVAHAAEAVRRLRTGGAVMGQQTALADAEATLQRLRARQAEDAAADLALQQIDAEAHSATVAEKLEAEGFGKRTKSTAASVLERLKQRQRPAGPATGPATP